MEEKETIARTTRFLRALKEELEKLQQADLTYAHFVIMGQTIEVLGGFLDAKPMKAKEQAAKRFSAAIRVLFGGKYRELNENRLLYDRLRNQLVHSFLPGKGLKLLNKNSNTAAYKHLDRIGDSIVMLAEELHEDLIKAINRLETLLASGGIKPKNIGFGDDE